MSKLDGLRLALEHSPDNAPLLLLYAQGCLEEFQLPEARETFLKLVRLQPTNPEGMTGAPRSSLTMGKGGMPKCASALRRAARPPSNACRRASAAFSPTSAFSSGKPASQSPGPSGKGARTSRPSATVRSENARASSTSRTIPVTTHSRNRHDDPVRCIDAEFHAAAPRAR